MRVVVKLSHTCTRACVRMLWSGMCLEALLHVNNTFKCVCSGGSSIALGGGGGGGGGRQPPPPHSY